MKALRLAALSVLVLLGGCAHIRNGIYSIPADCTDIVRLDLGFSIGTDMGGHIMLTKWVQFKSNSYEGVHKFGFGSRHIGWWMEDREDAWVGATRYGDETLRFAPVSMYAPALLHKWRNHEEIEFRVMGESADEIGLSLHLFLLGARVGVRPFEVVDLAANFIGMDPSNDNLSWEERKKLMGSPTPAAPGEGTEGAVDQPRRRGAPPPRPSD